MRVLIAIFVLAGAGLHGLAQQGAPTPPPEALCGFASGPHFYYEAHEVKRGLSVDMFVGQTELGQPITLRFFVNEKPRGNPVDRLQVEHEKLIHVIGVRDDLSGFFHVHPEKAGPGMWAVTLTLTNAGNYKIWSDVKYHGVSYAFGHPLLTIAGPLTPSQADHHPKDTVETSGYEVAINHAETFVAGRTNQFQFSIRDSHGGRVTTENFLGAPMHLVIMRDDLSTCLHAHPDHRIAGDPRISFTQVFPQEGTYKLFAQFRPAGTPLPPDEALLAEFYVQVGKAEPGVARRVSSSNDP